MSRYEDLEQISRDRKRDALVATAELGKANGLRAGAEIMRALAKGRKVVMASELLAAAQTIEEAARKLDAKTQVKLKEIESASS